MTVTDQAAPPAVPDFAFDIDLDNDRQRRAAAREVSEGPPIRFGGEVIATLPTELPLPVLAPLRKLDEEITLLLRQVMTVMNGSAEARERWDATSLVVDILAANPTLPTTVVDVIAEMGALLLTQDGWDALMAQGLTREDFTFLAGRIMGFYGFTLGELSPPSPSDTEEEQGGGTTSKQDGPATIPDSTSVESGEPPVAPASSEPAAS